MRGGRLGALAAVAATALGCAYTRIEVGPARLGRADVIVVPGAALARDGRARGVLHNRVAMAKVLLDRGFATRLLFTGGRPRRGRTEARVMAEIARGLGVQVPAILLEQEARTSVENGLYSAAIMRRAGLRSGLLVSDAVHLAYALPVFRRAFDAQGLGLYWRAVDYRLLWGLGTARSFLRKLDPAPERGRSDIAGW